MKDFMVWFALLFICIPIAMLITVLCLVTLVAFIEWDVDAYCRAYEVFMSGFTWGGFRMGLVVMTIFSAVMGSVLNIAQGNY